MNKLDFNVIKKFIYRNKEEIVIAGFWSLIAISSYLIVKKDKISDTEKKIQNKFLKFHEKIKLTREDILYKEVRLLDDNLLRLIKKELKKRGIEIEQNFLQGSFSTFTAIKSIDNSFDIDRALIITSNPPSCALDSKVLVEEILNSVCKKSKIKNPCVTAIYDDVHIDYPIYKQTFFGNYKLALGKKHSNDKYIKWQKMNPKELTEWINSNEDYNRFFYTFSKNELEQFRRVVKYLKRWRDLNFHDNEKKFIYSIGLTIMVRESFKASDGSDLNSLYKTLKTILSKDYFKEIDDNKFIVEVLLPTDSDIDVFKKHGTTIGTIFYRKINSLENDLSNILKSKNYEDIFTSINKIFGADFI